MKVYLFIITFFYIVDSFADDLGNFLHRFSLQHLAIQGLQIEIQKRMAQEATDLMRAEIQYLNGLKKALCHQIIEESIQFATQNKDFK